MDNEAIREHLKLRSKRKSLMAFLADRRASFSVQYAVLAAISGTATALAVRVVGNEIAARFESIHAALTRGGSGTLLP
jgi:Flp pilus assembly pilin Flp